MPPRIPPWPPLRRPARAPRSAGSPSRLQLFVARLAARDQLLAVPIDRIALLAHALYFFARSVLGGIGHRMAAVAIGLHLENGGAFAAARPGDRLFAGREHCFHIHSVRFFAGNVEGSAAFEELGLRA